jgi:hypothetical protein
MSAKALTLSEIDKIITLLDNSVNGIDNRMSKRTKVNIGLRFMIQSATGDMKDDIDQPMSPSYFVDLSKGGAGVVTGRRMAEGDKFCAKGIGDSKAFLTKLEVTNCRRSGNQYRYGCKVLELKVITQ